MMPDLGMLVWQTCLIPVPGVWQSLEMTSVSAHVPQWAIIIFFKNVKKIFLKETWVWC
jgi:hypothetical protein